MWDKFVRSQTVDFGSDLCGMSFFCVSMKTHMILHDVCMTRRTNSAIRQHLMLKSTPFALEIVPRQSGTSVHSVQEGSANISRSHFVRNMALDMKVRL